MHNLLSYFKDCYIEDRSRGCIQNVFRETVDFLQFVDGEDELIASPLRSTWLHSDKADELVKTAYVYRREKEFLYGTLFLAGVIMDDEGGQTEICAPLVFVPVAIEKQNELFAVAPQQGTPRFHYRLVETLLASLAPDTVDLRSEDTLEIEDMLSDGILEIGEVLQLAQILERLIPGLNTTEVIAFPGVLSAQELQRRLQAARRSNRTSLELVSASCMGLFPRGSDARGVLQDLDALCHDAPLSEPLCEILGTALPPAPATGTDGLSPAILSASQLQLMQAIATCRNTLMIGPPGTGKSYTIATLAMNCLSQGKSILITSGRDQAVDVIGQKIRQQLQIQECVVRGGTQTYLKQLKGYIQDILSGMYTALPAQADEEQALSRAVHELTKRREQLEKQIGQQGSREMMLGAFLANPHPGLLDRLRAWFAQRRATGTAPLWETFAQYSQVLDELVQKSRELISRRYQKQLAEAAVAHRPMLQRFLEALKARTGGKQEELLQTIDLSVLLSVLPVWLVKLTDLNRILPLQAAMFDLVVIDEATQCDIASCLPAIQRAKRVVIAGDPHQLRHISFLSAAKMHTLRETHQLPASDDLNYRSNSILDWYSTRLSNQKSVLFLNEHYRSAPQIIAFSNQHFYRNRLTIMTEKGVSPQQPALCKIRCDGTRDANGVNQTEIAAVVQQIVNITSQSAGMPPSIGILSPFRNQVDALAKAVESQLPLHTLQTHAILAGTAHTFQGEERDIMLLSLAVDDHSHSNVVRFIERPDVFNVSITRARTIQYVFHSISPDALPVTSLLRQYLAEAPSPEQQQAHGSSAHDLFAAQVQQALTQAGCDVQQGRMIAGMKMDLLAVQNSVSLCIDLIGYPGEFAPIQPMERYRSLMRAGMTVFPLSFSQWKKDPARCLAAIQERLSS